MTLLGAKAARLYSCSAQLLLKVSVSDKADVGLRFFVVEEVRATDNNCFSRRDSR